MCSSWPACAAILIGLFATTSHTDDGDTVALGNDSGEENGVIVWGSKDASRVFSGRSVHIDNIDTGDTNQVVAFTKGRPPALNDAVTWTAGTDVVSVDYPPSFEVPVKFWILCANDGCSGIPSNKKGKLAGFLVWANERLTEERAGFTLTRAGGDEWIVDETALTGDTADLLRNFKQEGCDNFDDAVSAITTPNAVNIYMVRTVEDSNGKADESNGWQCRENDDSAVVGRKAGWGTILHEIGHVFSLEHSDDETWSDEVGGDRNIMNSYSRTRHSLTEGQVFRMHFATRSGFNGNLSSLVPTSNSSRRPRDCKRQQAGDDLQCPPEQTMLWPDH